MVRTSARGRRGCTARRTAGHAQHRTEKGNVTRMSRHVRADGQGTFKKQLGSGRPAGPLRERDGRTWRPISPRVCWKREIPQFLKPPPPGPGKSSTAICDLIRDSGTTRKYGWQSELACKSSRAVPSEASRCAAVRPAIMRGVHCSSSRVRCTG